VQVVTTQSTINLDGTYVVLESIDIDGLSLSPTKTRLLPSITRKFELLRFGYVAQWHTFRRVVITNQLLCHHYRSLPRQLVFYSRFSTVDSCPLLISIKGYIHQMCRETPIDLRMGVPAPTTNFVGLTVTLILRRIVNLQLTLLTKHVVTHVSLRNLETQP
jgi:hypothetical protein